MRLFVFCALIVMGGCAANPASPPVSDAAAASPAPASPAAAQPAAAQPAEKVSKVPFDLPPGFKPTRISGELFYCRKMVVLGSRFPKQLCLNEDQLKDHMARTEAMKRNKDEVSRLCTSHDGCAWE
jgi:hypothetical protein